MPENFIPFVSCDPGGASVPGGYVSLRIHRENRVVFDTDNQQFEIFQALQPGFGRFSRLVKQNTEQRSDKRQGEEMLKIQRTAVMKYRNPGRQEEIVAQNQRKRSSQQSRPQTSAPSSQYDRENEKE